MDPARDGCGLIWYSPLVPMNPDRVSRYVDMVENICVAHGIEPLITLTSLSNRCFDSSVPLLFDRNDASQRVRAGVGEVSPASPGKPPRTALANRPAGTASARLGDGDTARAELSCRNR